jgi:hypothetical protein
VSQAEFLPQPFNKYPNRYKDSQLPTVCSLSGNQNPVYPASPVSANGKKKRLIVKCCGEMGLPLCFPTVQ